MRAAEHTHRAEEFENESRHGIECAEASLPPPTGSFVTIRIRLTSVTEFDTHVLIKGQRIVKHL